MLNFASNTEKRYGWDDSISVHHSGGNVFSVQLSKVRDTATFVWYTCTSCWKPTTLAWWNCWSCWNPFEVRDLNEAKSLFPTVSVHENDPNRVAYLLLNRAWVCMQCNSYNVSYPRTWDHSHISCVNCGSPYKEWESILLEDGDIVQEWVDPVRNFREKIMRIIEEKKNPPAVVHTWASPHRTAWSSYDSDSIPSPQIQPRASYQVSSSPSEKRNKIAIVSWILGAGFISWLVYYGMIQELDKQIQILWHSWERVISVEEYIRQSWENWERDVDKNSLDGFVLVSRRSKEASWDSYEVKTWTKEVTDYSSCTSYDTSCTSSTVTLSSGVVVEASGTCSKTCSKYGTKMEAIMEKRYRSHPYIEYTYMWWKQTDSLTTTWIDKQPYWHDWSAYKFDGKHLRQWSRREEYAVQLEDSDKNRESIKLPYPSWQALNVWDDCNVKATRWFWVKTSSLVSTITNCRKTDF